MVNSGIGIAWQTHTVERDTLHLSGSDDASEVYVEEGGFQVTLRKQGSTNFTSSLHVRDLGLNGTNLTCEAVHFTEMRGFHKATNDTTICVVGI